MPIAATANAARRTEAALGPMVRCGQGRAGERRGFIFRASIGLFRKMSIQKSPFGATP
jgi:hypothetical protein